MQGVNFVYFFTAQGFFVGLVFSLIKTSGPFELLMYTFLITAFFYMFSHVFVALYFRTLSIKREYFKKDLYEKNLDIFEHELSIREQSLEMNFFGTDDSNSIENDNSRRYEEAT